MSRSEAPRRPGRSLLQLPGPTNVPDEVLRAIAAPTIDHRGKAFAGIATSVLADVKPLFGTTGPIALYPGSGTGGWEAALVNTLCPGDRVVVCENGYFAAGWARLAGKLGLDVGILAGEWNRPPDPERLGEILRADAAHQIAAVLAVHNETSTGIVADIAAIRRAIDSASHPALLLVDAVSSLGAMPVNHDGWSADVTVTASQKGLMLPPGLVLLAVSDKARAAKRTSSLAVGYWDWEPMLAATGTGSFPYTPATNLVVGLRAAMDRILEEGVDEVFARHRRLAAAVRSAVEGWGLALLCVDPSAYSDSVTAVVLPEGATDAKVKAALLERWAVTIGGGLGRLAGGCLRIGHLGDVDELMIISALAAMEMELPWQSIPVRPGGVQAAMQVLGAAPIDSALPA